MPKLSRTQKFADLYGQLSNDNQQNMQNNEMPNYQGGYANQGGYQNQQNNWNNNQYNAPYQGNMNQNAYNPNQGSVNQNAYNNYYDSLRQYNGNVDNNQNVFNGANNANEQEYIRRDRAEYLNSTIDGVNSYNANNGQQTIDQIVNDSVNQVRHQEANNQQYNWNTNQNNQAQFIDNPWANYNKQNQQPQQPQLDADAIRRNNDDFSNTVSLEINNLMNEVQNTNRPQPQQQYNGNMYGGQQYAQPQPQMQQPQQPQMQQQNPDTMSSTIPFVVANDGEVVLDDAEEEGSNTVLNIILIVLIVVLIAVLGLIVFYILKTKGIF